MTGETSASDTPAAPNTSTPAEEALPAPLDAAIEKLKNTFAATTGDAGIASAISVVRSLLNYYHFDLKNKTLAQDHTAQLKQLVGFLAETSDTKRILLSVRKAKNKQAGNEDALTAEEVNEELAKIVQQFSMVFAANADLGSTAKIDGRFTALQATPEKSWGSPTGNFIVGKKPLEAYHQQAQQLVGGHTVSVLVSALSTHSSQRASELTLDEKEALEQTVETLAERKRTLDTELGSLKEAAAETMAQAESAKREQAEAETKKAAASDAAVQLELANKRLLQEMKDARDELAKEKEKLQRAKDAARKLVQEKNQLKVTAAEKTRDAAKYKADAADAEQRLEEMTECMTAVTRSRVGAARSVHFGAASVVPASSHQLGSRDDDSTAAITVGDAEHSFTYTKRNDRAQRGEFRLLVKHENAGWDENLLRVAMGFREVYGHKKSALVNGSMHAPSLNGGTADLANITRIPEVLQPLYQALYLPSDQYPTLVSIITGVQKMVSDLGPKMDSETQEQQQLRMLAEKLNQITIRNKARTLHGDLALTPGCLSRGEGTDGAAKLAVLERAALFDELRQRLSADLASEYGFFFVDQDGLASLQARFEALGPEISGDERTELDKLRQSTQTNSY